MHKTKRVAVVLALMGSACAARAVKKEVPLVETVPLAGPVQSARVVEASGKEQAPKKPAGRSVEAILPELEDNGKRYSAMYELSQMDLSSLDDKAAEQVKNSVVEAIRFDSEVAVPGIKVLGKLGGNSLIPVLESYSQSREDAVRAAVAKALGNIPGEDSVLILINLTGDRRDYVKRAAVESLAKIGAPAARHLANVLIGGNDDLRYAAVEALSAIGPESIAHIIPVLAHPDSRAVYHAVTALGNIGDDGAVQDLVALMSHPDNNVRGTAANALRKIGDKSALPALAQAADNDPSDFVRAAAKYAVEALSQ